MPTSQKPDLYEMAVEDRQSMLERQNWVKLLCYPMIYLSPTMDYACDTLTGTMYPRPKDNT